MTITFKDEVAKKLTKSDLPSNIKGRKIMARLIKDAYLASLGIVFLTYEKAEKLTQDLIKKGELAKNKQQELS